MSKKQTVVLTLFGAVMISCVLMIALGDHLSAYSGTALVDAGKEGLKAAISGLIGALSMLIGENNERR